MSLRLQLHYVRGLVCLYLNSFFGVLFTVHIIHPFKVIPVPGIPGGPVVRIRYCRAQGQCLVQGTNPTSRLVWQKKNPKKTQDPPKPRNSPVVNAGHPPVCGRSIIHSTTLVS